MLHELQIITIRFYGCNGEIIFVSDAIRAKMPQKPNFESKTIRILGEKGINSKVKHRKAQNAIWWPAVRETGRLLSYPGDSRIIRESWHVWNSWTAAPGNEVDRYNLLPIQPRFQINITPIKLVSKSIYHGIDGILLASFKFGQRQLKLLTN